MTPKQNRKYETYKEVARKLQEKTPVTLEISRSTRKMIKEQSARENKTMKALVLEMIEERIKYFNQVLEYQGVKE